MTDRTFIVRPSHLRETFTLAYQFAQALCAKGPVQVDVKPYVPPRSDPQNRALFGVAYPPLMEHTGLRGEKQKEELHEFLCGEFWGWVEYEIMGQKKQRPKRTTTRDENGKRQVISKSLFSEFYAFVQQKGAEVGCYVPDPDPEWFVEERRAA